MPTFLDDVQKNSFKLEKCCLCPAVREPWETKLYVIRSAKKLDYRIFFWCEKHTSFYVENEQF